MIRDLKNSLSWDMLTNHYGIGYTHGKTCVCPFHEDSTPSLSLNEKEPTFNCFGCGAKGDYFEFIALKEGLDCKRDFPQIKEIAQDITGTKLEKKKSLSAEAQSCKAPEEKPNNTQENYNNLASTKQVTDWFKIERGIEIETLEKAQVGLAAHPQIGGRAVIHFPYFDSRGNFIHNRIREIGDSKNVMSESGSKSSIYLAPNLKNSNRIFVTEGEIDALTILQHSDEVVGIPGSQSFLESFIPEFKNLEEIVFCGDNDKAGKKFNIKNIIQIKLQYPHIKTSYINWDGFPEKFDINDFYKSLSDKETLISELENRCVEKDFQKITPLQFFDKDFACTVVWQERFKENGKLISEPFLITSEGEKIHLEESTLYKKMLSPDRIPNAHTEWSIKSVEKFLRQHPTPSIKETFELLKTTLREYMSFEEERFYDLVPLWIMGTFFHRGMTTYPYLSLTGNKKCGKSKLLSFIQATSFQGLLNVGATAASTIRLVHSNHITCCVDEAENLGRASDENVQALLGIYNSGYKYGAKVPKCGHLNKVELFDSFSPKAFGGIAALNDTTASRCINLLMPPVKGREKFNREINSRDKHFLELRDSMYIHMLSDFNEILSTYRELESPSSELSGRDWEMWKPLLSLAQVIDSNLFSNIAALALKMTKQRKDSDFSAEDDIEFLKVISMLLEENTEPKGHLFIQDIKKALIETECDTFLELSAKYISNRWIGSWLKRLGVISKTSNQKKRNSFNLRYYEIDHTTVAKRLDALTS